MAEGQADQALTAEPKFPDAWGDCPPSIATVAEGIVYRRVNSNPVTAADFLSYIELGNTVTDSMRCLAFGLSVFRSIDDAKAYAERYPDSGRFIASATLDSSDGRTLGTPRGGNSHTTWWPFEGADRHAKFMVP